MNRKIEVLGLYNIFQMKAKKCVFSGLRGPQNHSLDRGGGGQKDCSVVVGRDHKFIFCHAMNVNLQNL